MSKLLTIVVAGLGLLIGGCAGAPTQEQAWHTGAATAVGCAFGYALTGNGQGCARAAAAGAGIGVMTAPAPRQPMGQAAYPSTVERPCQMYEGRTALYDACITQYNAAALQRAGQVGAVQGNPGVAYHNNPWAGMVRPWGQ